MKPFLLLGFILLAWSCSKSDDTAPDSNQGCLVATIKDSASNSITGIYTYDSERRLTKFESRPPGGEFSYTLTYIPDSVIIQNFDGNGKQKGKSTVPVNANGFITSQIKSTYDSTSGRTIFDTSEVVYDAGFKKLSSNYRSTTFAVGTQNILNQKRNMVQYTYTDGRLTRVEGRSYASTGSSDFEKDSSFIDYHYNNASATVKVNPVLEEDAGYSGGLHGSLQSDKIPVSADYNFSGFIWHSSWTAVVNASGYPQKVRRVQYYEGPSTTRYYRTTTYTYQCF